MTITEFFRKSFSSKGMRLLLMLVGLGAVAALYRLAMGLGAATNLSDDTPWGLWVAVDVLSGVALAAGGFTITAAVYIFNMKKYKSVVRPAILTAFIGYSVVVVGLIIDIGKPFSFWHPLVMWNYRSVMFEVVWCITLYTAVLALEFAPSFLEAVKWENALRALKIFTYPLVIAGIILSFLHQSSLGAFFLLAPQKLNHLWYSPILPQMFYISAIAAGLTMVSFESILSSRALGRGYEMDVLQGLARGARITLILYLIVKIGDIIIRGSYTLLGANTATFFWMLEILAGVILPIILYSIKVVRESIIGLRTAASLVLGGVLLNRFDVNFFTQAGTGSFYFPAVWEFLVTIGLVALAVMLYRLAVMHLPVFHEGALNR